MGILSPIKGILGCIVLTTFLYSVSINYMFHGLNRVVVVKNNNEVRPVKSAAYDALTRLNHILSRKYIAKLEDVRRKLLQSRHTTTAYSSPRNLSLMDANNVSSFLQVLKDRRVDLHVIWFTESESTMRKSMTTKYYKPLMNRCTANDKTCISRPEDVEESRSFSKAIQTDGVVGRFSIKGTAQSPPWYNFTYILVISGALVTSEGDVIKDDWKIMPMSCRWKSDQYSYFQPAKSYPRHSEVFVLSQHWGKTFFHFLIENLTRISAYLSFLTRHPDIKILVHKPSGFIRTLLAALGMDPSRLVSGDIQADVAYMPAGSPCGHATIFSAQALSLHFRSRLPEPAPPRDTIILIRRSQKRWFDHHDDILAMLRRHAKRAGLRTVVYGDDPVPGLGDTRRVFSRAYMVVAPHGAGESNLIFSQPGTILIEGLCHDGRGKVNWCYKNMMATLGHRYCGLLFTKPCMNITAEEVEPFVKYYVGKFKR